MINEFFQDMSGPDKNRTKHLLKLLGVVVLIGVLRPVWGPGYDGYMREHFHSQTMHLRQVEDHIRAIRPQWNMFTNQNAGFERAELFGYTGGDGMFAASGSVPSEKHRQKLKEFMEGTKPPRPVQLRHVFVREPE